MGKPQLTSVKTDQLHSQVKVYTMICSSGTLQELTSARSASFVVTTVSWILKSVLAPLKTFKHSVLPCIIHAKFLCLEFLRPVF